MSEQPEDLDAAHEAYLDRFCARWAQITFDPVERARFEARAAEADAAENLLRAGQEAEDRGDLTAAPLLYSLSAHRDWSDAALRAARCYLQLGDPATALVYLGMLKTTGINPAEDLAAADQLAARCRDALVRAGAAPPAG